LNDEQIREIRVWLKEWRKVRRHHRNGGLVVHGSWKFVARDKRSANAAELREARAAT
jgi:hypothetical protein